MSLSDQSRSERAWEVTATVANLPDKDLGYYLIGAMMGANYSWIIEPEKKKILEVLKMAQPFQDFYQAVYSGKVSGNSSNFLIKLLILSLNSKIS